MQEVDLTRKSNMAADAAILKITKCGNLRYKKDAKANNACFPTKLMLKNSILTSMLDCNIPKQVIENIQWVLHANITFPIVLF